MPKKNLFKRIFSGLGIFALTSVFIPAQLLLPASAHAADLFVEVSADPSIGNIPLNDVDLTAVVSGTATGDITYRFDCTNNGSFEKTITTGVTNFTAVDLCDYPNPGNFTAAVEVSRGGLTFRGTVGIVVRAGQDLFVTLSADPSIGNIPLNDVDLTAVVSGTATGDITYRFDCTNNGSFEKTITTGVTNFTAVDLCDYPNPGNFTASVDVTRDGLNFVGTIGILVKQQAPNLTVIFTPNPSSGAAPLNDVDLTAVVSGTTQGDITYRFDCTNDGSFERTVTTGNTSFTASDLCDYQNPGNFTARVRVERGGVAIEGTSSVIVFQLPTLSVDFTTSPSSGIAPLNDVDLTASVSGTAQGDITYRFDCTNDGSFDRTITTGVTSFTAVDLCDYSNTGNFTAKVRVERGGLMIEGNSTIVVSN